VIHGGAITALLDGASGAAVFATLTDFVPIATLDLRIDYLRPAEAGQDVHARATCYKLTNNVAFTRAVAYHEDPEDPIAHSVGTFTPRRISPQEQSSGSAPSDKGGLNLLCASNDAYRSLNLSPLPGISPIPRQ